MYGQTQESDGWLDSERKPQVRKMEKRKESVNVQGIGSLVTPRLERKLGQLSLATIAKVKDAIRFTLEL